MNSSFVDSFFIKIKTHTFDFYDSVKSLIMTNEILDLSHSNCKIAFNITSIFHIRYFTFTQVLSYT